jgi:hypothetical protein
MRSLINAALLISSLAAPVAGHGADDIRFDVTVLPEFRKYSALFSYPGYAVLVLENNGLRPSPGSKLIVKDGGHVIETRNSVLRFEGRKGDLYSYELGAVFDLAFDIRFTFPVVVDASSLSHGKITVAMKPPLASLFPTAFKTRVLRRVYVIAEMSAQTKVLAYLDQLTKKSSEGTELSAMIEAILLDAYNGSGGRGDANRGSEQTLPTRDQWMLIIIFMSWLFLVSALLVVYLWRQRHGKSA